MRRRYSNNTKIDKSIISLFHCDTTDGIDARGFAIPTDKSLQFWKISYMFL